MLECYFILTRYPQINIYQLCFSTIYTARVLCRHWFYKDVDVVCLFNSLWLTEQFNNLFVFIMIILCDRPYFNTFYFPLNACPLLTKYYILNNLLILNESAVIYNYSTKERFCSITSLFSKFDHHPIKHLMLQFTTWKGSFTRIAYIVPTP